MTNTPTHSPSNSPSEATLLSDLPMRVTIPVAWGDLDALQHVNSTVYFRWFETARVALFRRVGWLGEGRADGVGPILARASCVFRLPVGFSDTVEVGVASPNWAGTASR